MTRGSRSSRGSAVVDVNGLAAVDHAPCALTGEGRIGLQPGDGSAHDERRDGTSKTGCHHDERSSAESASAFGFAYERMADPEDDWQRSGKLEEPRADSSGDPAALLRRAPRSKADDEYPERDGDQSRGQDHPIVDDDRPGCRSNAASEIPATSGAIKHTAHNAECHPEEQPR